MVPIKLRWSLVSFVLVAACASTGGVSAAVDTETTKLYLLASDEDFLYWSPDPADPEMAALSAYRSCAPHYPAGLCTGASAAGGLSMTMPFLPGAVLEGPVDWGSGRPLRFHIEADLTTSTPATVHAIAGSSAGLYESAAATQVAPGVFEGTIDAGHQVFPGDVLALGVRVRVPEAVRVTMAAEIRTAGQSWIEFPGDLPIAPVPELLKRSTYARSPSSYATPDRSFRFNDRAWESFVFTGNLSEAQTFSVPLDRPAAAVVGWVEGFSEPFIYGLGGGDAGARSPFDTAFVRLISNGSEISQHRYSATAVDVPDGTLEMRVEPIEQSGERPYRAHLVVIDGERTLSSMRWRFEVPAHQHRVMNTSSCAVPLEQVPATEEVTTFRVDMNAESTNPLPKKWAMVFNVPDWVNPGFCGTLGGGSGVRFAIGGPRVGLVGPGPAPDAATLSAYDTQFEAEVRYAYTPLPPCGQAAPGEDCEPA
ncbi:MAG TPA: hypothetical protein VEA19_00805 [Actinomycetota bacterium]|nr:hypothetical protein [Actinomycetota bacterium]